MSFKSMFDDHFSFNWILIGIKQYKDYVETNIALKTKFIFMRIDLKHSDFWLINDYTVYDITVYKFSFLIDTLNHKIHNFWYTTVQSYICYNFIHRIEQRK